MELVAEAIAGSKSDECVARATCSRMATEMAGVLDDLGARCCLGSLALMLHMDRRDAPPLD